MICVIHVLNHHIVHEDCKFIFIEIAMLKYLYDLIALKKKIINSNLVIFNCYCSVHTDDQQYERSSDNDLIPSIRTENHQNKR